MVAGHLQEKNGIFYVVLSYPDTTGKRKAKWISTGLPVKGNKKKAEKMLMEQRASFIAPCKPLTDGVLFSDFMLQWLEIVKPTIAVSTYASYSEIVKGMGNLMSPQYLSGAFPKFLEKNGLRKIRFHDLRHSCASLLLANGVSMKQIQEWLGHSDFSTTANVYAHLDYNSKLSSANAMVNGLQNALSAFSDSNL